MNDKERIKHLELSRDRANEQLVAERDRKRHKACIDLIEDIDPRSLTVEYRGVNPSTGMPYLVLVAVNSSGIRRIDDAMHPPEQEVNANWREGDE